METIERDDCMYKVGKLKTDVHGVHDITDEVKEMVREEGIKSGLCCVYVPHTTAGITLYSGVDPLGLLDLNDAVKQMIPTRADFHHQCDGPTDAAGHIKSSLIGASMTFIVEDGELVLGGSQSIYFFEFDGPRDRQYFVKVIGQ